MSVPLYGAGFSGFSLIEDVEGGGDLLILALAIKKIIFIKLAAIYKQWEYNQFQ